MKKLLLLTSILVFSLPSFSQITLGTADFPHSGDIDTSSIATAFSGMDYLTTDTNYYWDFQNLDSTTTGMRIDTFVTVASTGNIFSLYFGFLNPANQALHKADVNLGPISITGVYDFFQNTAADYHQSGFGGTPGGLPITLPVANIPLGYKPPDVIYKFPVKYGNIDSCAPVDTLGLTGVLYFKGEKTRHNQVDGWGKVTTPYGTFDCLRIKSIVHEHDTVHIDTLGIGFAFDQPERIEYKWLGKKVGEPLLEVVTTGGTVSEITYYGYPICPVAAFTTTQDTITQGTTLNFTNTTTKTNNYQWKIDGNTFATTKDASYTFNTPGTYMVTLVAVHLNCVEVVNKVITVFYKNCNLAASYHTPLDTIFDKTGLYFTNTSNPISSYGTYLWQVDGFEFSTSKDAGYLFNTPGTYIVTMIATDLNCVDSTSKLITVFYTNCDLGTAFYASNESVFEGQNVAFIGSSKAPVTYSWWLNGAYYSGAMDTAHVFNTAGTYPVTLITSYLNCSDTVNKFITVLPPAFNLQVYPVPVSKEVTIFCTLPEQSDVRIDMYDILGQTLVSDQWTGLPAGEHYLSLSIPPATNAASVYYLRINWKGGEVVKNLTVIK